MGGSKHTGSQGQAPSFPMTTIAKFVLLLALPFLSSPTMEGAAEKELSSYVRTSPSSKEGKRMLNIGNVSQNPGS